MEALLRAYLAEGRRIPFRFGEWDCGMWLANWWRRVHGTDPATQLRGRYASETECLAVLVQGGSLPRVVAALAAAAGARRIARDAAGPGDFGVVRMGDAHYGAIRTPAGSWAMKSPRGVLVATPAACRVVAAWAIK